MDTFNSTIRSSYVILFHECSSDGLKMWKTYHCTYLRWRTGDIRHLSLSLSGKHRRAHTQNLRDTMLSRRKNGTNLMGDGFMEKLSINCVKDLRTMWMCGEEYWGETQGLVKISWIWWFIQVPSCQWYRDWLIQSRQTYSRNYRYIQVSSNTKK
jgi:hypothetical protein